MTTPTLPQPWGRASGLLTACAVTGVGVCVKLDPDVILRRAAISAVVVGVTISVLVHMWNSLEDE